MEKRISEDVYLYPHVCDFTLLHHLLVLQCDVVCPLTLRLPPPSSSVLAAPGARRPLSTLNLPPVPVPSPPPGCRLSSLDLKGPSSEE